MFAFGSRPELKLPFMILIALVITSLPAVASAGSEVVIYESSISPDLWSWDKSSDGKIFPILEGARSLSEPGLPALPVQDLTFLIPAGRVVADAWVEPLATRSEKLIEPLLLAPPHITDGGEFISTSRMQAEKGVFPTAWGEFSGTHTWRGYNLLTLSVYPARMDNQEITYLEDYAVRVIYADGLSERVTIERERFVPGESAANEEILRGILTDPRAVSGYSRIDGAVVAEDKGPFNPTRTPSLSGSAVQYLIITNEEMKDEFQRLADYKTSLGMQTIVATREYISANFRNGADIQETIRMFIQDAYGKWGTEYVLLGGDTDILPARYVDNTFYPASGSTAIPVDLYFACLDGNWNANGNAHFGEADGTGFVGDDVDFAEEVFLGRATVSSAVAAGVFVDKVITYENAPHGSQWTNRVLYACEVLFPSEYEEGNSIILDGAQFSDQMVNDLVEPCTDMEYLRMYETDALFPRDANLSKAALIDSLNSGNYGIFNQIGHGFYFNMSVGNENFMTTDADALVNGDHLFALFSLNCASAAFDYSCLMERFLQNPNGGSIVSIGSSRAAFPNNSNNYQQGFFEALFCSPDNRTGKLVALSRLPYLGNTIYNYVDRWTFENYTLLGDPTLPLWAGVPDQIQVSAPTMDLGPNQISIVVNNAGQPVENAEVCLSRGGEDYAIGMTNAAGAVSLDYLANTAGDVNLRVTGEDLAQYISSVEVLDGTTYLALMQLVISDNDGDGSQGNNNGEMEAGEIVNIFPLLRETAGSGTTGLSGVLSTTDLQVNITTDTVTYGNISGGGVTGPPTSFIVSFGSEITDGTAVPFKLTMTDAALEVYEVEWTTVVKAPEVEIVLMDWEDTTYGNGDGFLGNGERVVVSVDLKNFGAGRADHIDLSLRTSNANVVLFDTEGTVTELDLMESSGDLSTFSLSLSDASRKSESYFLLTDNYGRTTRHDFVLQRPDQPLNISTDTSLGADVIALSWDPVDEEGLFGYNIFRSLNAGGPFERVNQDVVFGTSYYRDEGLGQLTKYYYKIGSVGYSLVPSVGSLVVEQATAPAEREGFPVAFLNETSGNLAVGDVDGNGYPEIVLGSDELYVWHHDGTELLNGDNDSQSLGPITDNNMKISAGGIVLAQLDDQPGLEMIYCEKESPELVYVLNKDGEVMPGWPQSTDGGSGTQWVWASPAAGDIDGDGDLEIIMNSLNGRTWAWHHDGTEVIDGDDDPTTNGVFKIRSGATWEWILSSPALCDLDGDGAKDIIFGTANDDLGNKLVAYKADGSDVAGFPYFTANRVNNSPAVGDLNNDGIMEIVFYDKSGWLYAVQQDGTDYPGFPVSYGIGTMAGGLPSVGLGDLDEDGELEIIFAGNVNGDLSKLICVDTDISGGTSGQPMNGWPLELPGSSEGSPVVGDIDGDTIPDILFGIGGGSEDAPNNLYAFKANGNPIDGFPITLGGPLMPSPVICDIDNDLDVDIVMGGWDRLVHVWDMPFAYDPRNCPWPTFQGTAQRDGVINRDFPVVSVEDDSDIPAASFKVDAPYPNPFNPSTSIRLHVPAMNGASTLELVVYDLQGRKVRTLHNGAISSGWHTMVWDGQDNAGRSQSSGMYFIRARSGQHSSIHKMTLVK